MPLVSSAPPASVRRDLIQPVAEEGTSSRVPREELVVAAGKGLALMSELLPEPPALWWPIAAASSDVVGDPAARAAVPCLGCQSCNVGEAGLTDVGSVDGVELVLCRPLCVKVGHLLALHAQVGGSPSDRDRAALAHKPAAGLDGLHCETMS